MYDPLKDDIRLSVSDSKYAWYFDSGASKPITSCKKIFVTLEDACHKTGIITCANTASYIISHWSSSYYSHQWGCCHLEQCSLCPWHKEKPSFGFHH